MFVNLAIPSGDKKKEEKGLVHVNFLILTIEEITIVPIPCQYVSKHTLLCVSFLILTRAGRRTELHMRENTEPNSREIACCTICTSGLQDERFVLPGLFCFY